MKLLQDFRKKIAVAVLIQLAGLFIYATMVSDISALSNARYYVGYWVLLDELSEKYLDESPSEVQIDEYIEHKNHRVVRYLPKTRRMVLIDYEHGGPSAHYIHWNSLQIKFTGRGTERGTFQMRVKDAYDWEYDDRSLNMLNTADPVMMFRVNMYGKVTPFDEIRTRIQGSMQSSKGAVLDTIADLKLKVPSDSSIDQNLHFLERHVRNRSFKIPGLDIQLPGLKTLPVLMWIVAGYYVLAHFNLSRFSPPPNDEVDESFLLLHAWSGGVLWLWRVWQLVFLAGPWITIAAYVHLFHLSSNGHFNPLFPFAHKLDLPDLVEYFLFYSTIVPAMALAVYSTKMILTATAIRAKILPHT